MSTSNESFLRRVPYETKIILDLEICLFVSYGSFPRNPGCPRDSQKDFDIGLRCLCKSIFEVMKYCRHRNATGEKILGH
jgi:hypothetical protein